MTVIPTSPSKLPADFQKNFPTMENSLVQQTFLKELDTSGDGKVSESEFAAYRARKQAIGEYVPLQNHSNSSRTSAGVQQVLFEILTEAEQS